MVGEAGVIFPLHQSLPCFCGVVHGTTCVVQYRRRLLRSMLRNKVCPSVMSGCVSQALYLVKISSRFELLVNSEREERVVIRYWSSVVCLGASHFLKTVRVLGRASQGKKAL